MRASFRKNRLGVFPDGSAKAVFELTYNHRFKITLPGRVDPSAAGRIHPLSTSAQPSSPLQGE